jgi:sugar O-acyltransferase (sialic acid O-acetyltransferase NeuD family)
VKTTTRESRVFVYGASGQGKVVADILRACGIEVDGFVDDHPEKCNAAFGLRIMGDGQWLVRQAADGPVAVALGVGDNFCRRMIAEKCNKANIQILSAVHPSATVAPSANILPGVVIMAHAVVNSDARIGPGSIINTAAIVEHDCNVGNFTHLSPRVALGGNVQVADMSWLGIGSTVLPGVRIGTGSIVGAGATVIRDVGDWVVVVGTPARILKESVHRL